MRLALALAILLAGCAPATKPQATSSMVEVVVEQPDYVWWGCELCGSEDDLPRLQVWRTGQVVLFVEVRYYCNGKPWQVGSPQSFVAVYGTRVPMPLAPGDSIVMELRGLYPTPPDSVGTVAGYSVLHVAEDGSAMEGAATIVTTTPPCSGTNGVPLRLFPR